MAEHKGDSDAEPTLLKGSKPQPLDAPSFVQDDLDKFERDLRARAEFLVDELSKSWAMLPVEVRDEVNQIETSVEAITGQMDKLVSRPMTQSDEVRYRWLIAYLRNEVWSLGLYSSGYTRGWSSTDHGPDYIEPELPDVNAPHFHEKAPWPYQYPEKKPWRRMNPDARSMKEDVKPLRYWPSSPRGIEEISPHQWRTGKGDLDDLSAPGPPEESSQRAARADIAAKDRGEERAAAPGSAGSIISRLRGGKGPGQSLASMAGGPGRRVDNNRYAHGKRVPGAGDGLPSGPANPAKAKSTTPGQAPQPKDNTKDSQGSVREQGRPDPKPTDSSTGPKGGTGGGGGGTGGTPTSPQNPNPPSAPGGGPAPTDGGSSSGSTPTQPTTAGGGSSGSGGSTGGSSGGGGGSTGGTSGGGTSPSGRSGSGGKGGGGSQPKPDPPKPEQDPNKTDKGKSQPKAPTKDPPPDPKKHGNSNPNPEDSGSGSGGPRASGGQNENPNPEDGGAAGGPRAGAASRERPGDDDSSGIYYRRRGPGGGVGGPRAYDAYPDPESSGGGVGPRTRYERPNPEDTGSPHGPSARTAISWSSATRNRMV